MEIAEFYIHLKNKSYTNLKELIDSSGAKIDVDFVRERIVLWEIYNNRLGPPDPFDYPTFEGMKEVVEKLKNSQLSEVRLTLLDFEDGSISLFTSPGYTNLLGYIIYPPVGV